MGIAPAAVLHTAAGSAELVEHLRPCTGLADDIMLGLAMSPDRVEEALALRGAAAHASRS
jgi:hypothetical protein